MKVYLVQHGKAKSKEEDPLRGLNKDGIAETMKTASYLARCNPAPMEILYSEKLRAIQTAEIFAEKLINKRGIRKHRQLAPNDPVSPVLKEIKKINQDLMIIGHLPHLSILLSQLLYKKDDSCPVQFRNSAIVCVEIDKENCLIQWIIHPDYPLHSE